MITQDTTGSATDVVDVDATKSDTIDFTAGALGGFYVGVTGNVKVNTIGGQTITLTAIPAGTVIKLCVSRVWSAGTTATGIVGFQYNR